MRHVLVDTHIALWIMADDPKLPAFVRSQLSSGIDWVFHQVSTWEIQIKYSLGKLPLTGPPEIFLRDAIDQTGFSYRPIEDAGIFMLGKLPDYHRDPFDRLLIAHALVHGWELATVDENIQRYPVRVFS